MPTLTDVEQDIKKLSTKALEVVEDASRPWSERASEVEKYESDIKALEATHADIKAEHTARSRFSSLAENGDVVDTPEKKTETVKSIGALVADSVKDMTGRFNTKSIEFGDASLKATLTEAAGGAGTLIPQYLPGLTEILFRKPRVASLLPSGSANGASIIYLKESAVTNAAAAVAEGGAKPGSDLNVTTVTENWHKIATSLKIADEMLRDYAFTMSYVDARLTLFVQLAEDDALLNGSGSGANMTGLLTRSGKQTDQALGSDVAPDAIYKAITKIRVNAFLEPDGVIISPNNWQTIRLSKDSNGQYYAGGPFTGAYGNGSVMTSDMLWGLPVVVTPAIADGTALVGAFQPSTQRFVQGGLTVESTNSNEDDFLHDLVAVRAEIREILAVYRPGGLCKVTGLA
jgi:HK97 family phage major capsid protein